MVCVSLEGFQMFKVNKNRASSYLKHDLCWLDAIIKDFSPKKWLFISVILVCWKKSIILVYVRNSDDKLIVLLEMWQ